MKKYFYSDGTKNLAPFSLKGLREKNITIETLVWFQELNEWLPANSFSQLNDIFAPSTLPITGTNSNNSNVVNNTHSQQPHKTWLAVPVLALLFFASTLLAGCSQGEKVDKNTEIEEEIENEEKVKSFVAIAYVSSGSNVIPDPTFVTHFNYAFGRVNNTFDGIRIDNEKRLKQIAEIKKEHPHLQVLLSIGGWGSGGFSEMAADITKRQSFALDCQRVILDYGLDGVDIDWEYPTMDWAGISAAPEDTYNFTSLMIDIRNAIGNDKLLTLASVSTAKYVDFRAIDSSIDFINIMAYDMAKPPKHHSPLYRSPLAGNITVEESVKYHLAAGISKEKLVLGMPFYGVVSDGQIGFRNLEKQTKHQEKWDDIAKVPYLVNDDGELICTFENQRSIAIKCQFIKEKGLLGAMYWWYGGDNEEGTLRKTVYNELNK